MVNSIKIGSKSYKSFNHYTVQKHHKYFHNFMTMTTSANKHESALELLKEFFDDMGYTVQYQLQKIKLTSKKIIF